MRAYVLSEGWEERAIKVGRVTKKLYSKEWARDMSLSEANYTQKEYF